MKFNALLALLLVLTVSPLTQAADRDIQFRTIDFTSGTIELFNFGGSSVDLSGWRLCTHDEDQIRRYTSPAALNGVSIAAGESLIIHTNNDAAAANAINVSSLGNFAGPFDQGSFGMQIYFDPVSFGNGNQIADHIQWSLGGVDNTTADERSDEAENGGVWIDQNEWISTSSTTTSIVLTDTTGGVLHSPANYVVIPEPATLALAGLALTALVSRRRH